MRLSEINADQRIELASKKIRKLVDHLVHIINLHETNRIVTYSPTLSAQIPQSFAAHAFNLFQDTMFRYEVVRLCAIWDSAKPDDLHIESIPTVIMLINGQAVIGKIIKKIHESRLSMPFRVLDIDVNDPIQRASIERLKKSNADNAAHRCSQGMDFSIFHANKIEASGQLRSLKNIRNKHLAHSLAQTYKEANGPIPLPKYGYERSLLLRSILIVDRLYLAVCDTSFDWKESIRIAKKNSEALWNGCKFHVLR